MCLNAAQSVVWVRRRGRDRRVWIRREQVCVARVHRTEQFPIFLQFQDAAHRRFERPVIERIAVQAHQCESPIQTFSRAGNLLKRLLAHPLHKTRDLGSEPLVDLGQTREQNCNLTLERRIVDAEVEAATAQCVERSRERFDVTITAGRSFARIVPTSGMVT